MGRQWAGAEGGGREIWRLLIDLPPFRAGAENMGIDDALLQSMRPTSLPILRLYGWKPACLSLGYGQRAREADWGRLEDASWDCVRRPTGGRAILHDDELTYSLTFPIDHPLAQRTILESYQAISDALTLALTRIGVSTMAEPKSDDHTAVQTPVCFDTPAHYELTVEGRKLVGSAQVRRQKGVLQHGSLPLSGDIAAICDGLTYTDDATRAEAKTSVRARALTLADALGFRVTWETGSGFFTNAFAETFDIVWENSTLNAEEAIEAERLTRETYSRPEWTMRRV